MQKITDVQFRKRVKELGGGEYIPLDPYTGAKCKIRMKHLPCGEARVITASEFLRGGARCQTCRKKEQKANKFEEIKDELHKKYGDDYTVLDTEYKTLNTKMRVRHNVCGHVINVSMHLLLRQPVCSFCHGGVKSSNKKFKKRVKELVGNEYVFLGSYVNSATKIRVKHNKCGYVYKARPNDFLRGYGRCPKCSSMVHNLILKYIYEDFNISEWYIPYDYEGIASCSESELSPGYKDAILWGGIPDKLILEQANLVLKDLESHGIKIANSYTEDGELIVYVDESIYKDGK